MMSRRRFGSWGRPADDEARAAQDGAVAAFLDLDTRQRFVAEAVASVASLGGPLRGRGAENPWTAVEQQCFTAGGHYLSISQQFPPGGALPPEAVARYREVHGELAAAAAAVDSFYAAHRAELDSARAAVNALPTVVRQARVRAAGALEAALTSPVAGYSSVTAAQLTLDQACSRLDAAQGIAETNAAATAVDAAATALEQAVTAAAGAGDGAREALASVRTRIDGIRTQADRLPETNSALLREFSAASSRDLSGVLREVDRHLDEGEQDWRAASSLLTSDPEQALARIASAREHLSEAEEAGRRLTSRLTDLRAVRSDPEAELKQARFRVRDAQRLVVSAGLIGEWGSVLDAQMARLDRAASGLSGVHPDYWAYLGELRAVTTFVRDVVDRVRNQIAER